MTKLFTSQITHAWQPENPVQFPSNAWLMPDKETYFFCDLHADAEAFLRSLKLSQLVTEESSLEEIQLTDKGLQGQIMIGGDCFDKGPSNLQLFHLLHQLKQQQVDLVLLAGNHDIRVYAGLLALNFMDDLRQSHFFVRMGRKVASFLAEVYETYCLNEPTPTLSESTILKELMPQDDWFERFPEYAVDFMTPSQIDKEIRQIKHKKVDLLNACADFGLELNQVYQAAHKAKQLFIDEGGEFNWFFRELVLMHRSGSYLFSHAGLDDHIAEQILEQGVEKLNIDFKHAMSKGLIFQMYYSAYGNVFRTKYREKDFPLTEVGSRVLKSQKIFALVNGHRSHLNGQQLFVRQGLLNFECDTQLNANCRKQSQMNTPGEAVTIFSINGIVSALCSELSHPKQFHPEMISA